MVLTNGQNIFFLCSNRLLLAIIKLKYITQQSSNFFMASVDMDSLFTNMPLDKTIEKCVNKLFKSGQTVSGLNKNKL